MESLLPIVSILLLLALVFVTQRLFARVRENRVRTYMFPAGLIEKLGAKHPQLSLKDRQLVARGLRQFFLAHLRSGRKFVSMPSQIVDDLWHEFILYTREYDAFCRRALGKFMHHTPAVVLTANKQNNTGLRRVWWFSCLEENINPRAATRLPLLFALDEKLNIPGGFRYALDCKGVQRAGEKKGDGAAGTPYCGGDMSSSDFDGSTDGFGDDSGSDGGGGDSGGDGGCGGGCGGGE